MTKSNLKHLQPNQTVYVFKYDLNGMDNRDGNLQAMIKRAYFRL